MCQRPDLGAGRDVMIMKHSNLLSYSDSLGRSSLLRGVPPWRRLAHVPVYIGIALAFGLTIALSISYGDVKAWSEIDWLDVAGEGSLTVATLVWLHFLLAWRPPGPVTGWLTAGFSLLAYGFFLDTLDEVVRMADTLIGASLESVVSPVSIALITFAVLMLSREQRVLGRQLQRREAHYRNHRNIDAVTDLYSGAYLEQVLSESLLAGRPVSLCLIDLNDFNSINLRYGFAVGDAVLNRAAHTLVAAAPSDSLVCRYGGDRFALLLGEDGAESRDGEALEMEARLGRLLGEAVDLALLHETGEPLGLSVAVVQCGSRPGESAAALMQRASAALQQRKRTPGGA